MPYANREKALEYYRKYHLKNWGKRKVKHQEWKRKRRAKLAEWLRTYKKNLSCIRCKEDHPACIDFHHLNAHEKEGTIANMISEGYSIKTITGEIKKCVVLCKNCHAKEHFELNRLIHKRE